MDKLKKNAFWAGVGAALVVLLILFVVMILPKFAEQTRLQTQIRNANRDLEKALADKSVHSTTSIQEWTASKQQMLTSYKKITDFYTASDRHFERWFDGFGGGDRGTFMARYREEITKLEGSLTERKTEIGIPGESDPTTRRFGFNWEEPLPNQWEEIIKGGPAEEARVLKELQKRFWIRQRVAQAVMKGDVKVTRIHDFRFFRRLSTGLRDAGWDQPTTGADAVSWPGVRTDARNFQEFDLPNELGKSFSFGFALKLPYSEVPKVLKEILNPDIEPRNDTGSDRLLVNLIGAQITLKEQNRPSISFWYYEGDEADKAAKRAKAFADAGMSEITPRDVLLAVTCHIVDFDGAKVKPLTVDPIAAEPAPKQ